jgi:hypothetical protein
MDFFRDPSYNRTRDCPLNERRRTFMNTWRTEFNEKIAAQGAHLPSMYDHLDPSNTPERFAPEAGDQTELEPEFLDQREELLAKQEQVERVRAYTMIGDPVADAYAAMIPTCGFPKLVGMLEQACDHGLESVPSAPPELVRFIQDMERLPDWLDPKLIEQGARLERNDYANKVPFGIRGGFIPTFMNKYSALPMVLTGALSHNSSARRVKETATFFTSMVMPDVLDRHSGAFKSAAMVRLMHSMVRFNLLHGDKWDIKVYGIPIPQIDPPDFFQRADLPWMLSVMAARRLLARSARASNLAATAAFCWAFPKNCSRIRRRVSQICCSYGMQLCGKGTTITAALSSAQQWLLILRWIIRSQVVFMHGWNAGSPR